MKSTLFTFIIFAALLSSCTLIKPTYKVQKSLTASTVQSWSGGAAGSGRGLTFRMKFYNLQNELKADTLMINGLPFETEITHVGDTTYVSAFYYTEQQKLSDFMLAEEYSGALKVELKGKKRQLKTETFKRLPPALHP